MKLQIIARSRHKHSTCFIQVVYNQACIYSSMPQRFVSSTLVAEPYKCKLLALQSLNVCKTFYRVLVSAKHQMIEKQQTKDKSKLVPTDTKRIKNVQNLAGKSYKHVHPMSMKYIKLRRYITQ